ncbi:MAG: PEP-CTERM sorting domain-containing protein [Planctomycetota bacterium]
MKKSQAIIVRFVMLWVSTILGATSIYADAWTTHGITGPDTAVVYSEGDPWAFSIVCSEEWTFFSGTFHGYSGPEFTWNLTSGESTEFQVKAWEKGTGTAGYVIDYYISTGLHGVDNWIVDVINLSPRFMRYSDSKTVNLAEPFELFCWAYDPGGDPIACQWDYNNDGTYDVTTPVVEEWKTFFDWSFDTAGLHEIGLRISDGDGGAIYHTFEVNVIPEPATILLLGLGGLILRKI